MAVSFDSLRMNYPTGSQAELFHQLGGEWPNLIGNNKYKNTCAIRLSTAFNGTIFPISSPYREAIDGANKNIILKVKTMDRFMKEAVGEYSWGMSKQPGVPINAALLPGKTGVIAYHSNLWTDATGHFDLWTGNDFVGTGDIDDIKDGFDIVFWHLE